MTTRRPTPHRNTAEDKEGARSTNDHEKGPKEDDSYEANSYEEDTYVSHNSYYSSHSYNFPEKVMVPLRQSINQYIFQDIFIHIVHINCYI